MKAVNYAGPSSVKVSEVEKPKLEHPDDIIVKVTTVSISSATAFRFKALLTLLSSRRPFAVQICSM